MYIIDRNELNQLAIQFEPLVHKIAHQNENFNVPYNDLVSAGYEGFLYANENYSEEKSNGQTFRQYAGNMINNFIKNFLTNNSRLIRISGYKQNQIKEGKELNITTTSLDLGFDGEDMFTDHIIAIGVEDNHIDEIGSLNALFKDIEAKFSERDCDILYKRFGLNNRKLKSCNDLAKEYNVSAPRISKILKDMYAYIRTKQELCDDLRDLLTKITE